MNNGVVRIGRKGIVKFAFGDDGAPFDVDVVGAWQQFRALDEQFRIEEGAPHEYEILQERMPSYHAELVQLVKELGGAAITTDITTAEALDFFARLREQYEDLATFFRPKSREERDSPASLGVELRFSEEPAQN